MSGNSRWVKSRKIDRYQERAEPNQNETWLDQKKAKPNKPPTNKNQNQHKAGTNLITSTEDHRRFLSCRKTGDHLDLFVYRARGSWLHTVETLSRSTSQNATSAKPPHKAITRSTTSNSHPFRDMQSSSIQKAPIAMSTQLPTKQCLHQMSNELNVSRVGLYTHQILIPSTAKMKF